LADDPDPATTGGGDWNALAGLVRQARSLKRPGHRCNGETYDSLDDLMRG
jgi:hypothetical protein